MGHVLAYNDVKRAKVIAATCLGFVMLLAIIVATLMYHLQEQVIALFTNDEQVVLGCEQIWPKVCFYIIMNFVFGINGGILRALGMQWHMAAIICIVLWFAALPTLIYVTVIREGGVNAIWTCLPLFYLVLNVLLVHSYVTADWNSVSREVQRRKSSIAETIANETTLLLDGIEPPN